jgi:hypothetical protein
VIILNSPYLPGIISIFPEKIHLKAQKSSVTVLLNLFLGLINFHSLTEVLKEIVKLAESFWRLRSAHRLTPIAKINFD